MDKAGDSSKYPYYAQRGHIIYEILKLYDVSKGFLVRDT